MGQALKAVLLHIAVKPPLLEIAAFACSHLASKKKVQRVVGRSLTQHMLRDVLCARANLERRKKKKKSCAVFFAGCCWILRGARWQQNLPSPGISPEALGSVKDDLEGSACKKLLLLPNVKRFLGTGAVKGAPAATPEQLQSGNRSAWDAEGQAGRLGNITEVFTVCECVMQAT